MSHIACRAIIIHEETNKVLLVKHHGSSFWSLPGGKREENESLKECVARELQEELGIESTVLNCMAINEFRYTPESVPSLEFFFRVSVDETAIKLIESSKNGSHFEKELSDCEWKTLDANVEVKPDFLRGFDVENKEAFYSHLM